MSAASIPESDIQNAKFAPHPTWSYDNLATKINLIALTILIIGLVLYCKHVRYYNASVIMMGSSGFVLFSMLCYSCNRTLPPLSAALREKVLRENVRAIFLQFRITHPHLRLAQEYMQLTPGLAMLEIGKMAKESEVFINRSRVPKDVEKELETRIKAQQGMAGEDTKALANESLKILAEFTQNQGKYLGAASAELAQRNSMLISSGVPLSDVLDRTDHALWTKAIEMFHQERARTV